MLTQNLQQTDTPPFVFGTKAETLERLCDRLVLARLCDQRVIAVGDWRNRRVGLTDDLVAFAAGMPLVVRSSSRREDLAESSMAGVFESVTDVACDAVAIADAVDSVIASYGDADGADQVLVQPMVSDIAVSGVVLTRELDSGAPYYVISYDDDSGRSDSVTSGAAAKTLLVHRSHAGALRSGRFRKLIDAVAEIESAVGSDRLDIEFCITRDDEIYVFQVRPIAAATRWRDPDDGLVDEALDALRANLTARMGTDPAAKGGTTIFGEMPDWNPAEIIGNTPRPLALSLYRHLITDETWWRARAAMGYRTVSEPLLEAFCGRPFIDVRRSLNSFLPANLGPDVAERLIDHQISRLADDRALHDRIEFDIAVTCLDFDIDAKVSDLRQAGFSASDLDALHNGLREITVRAVDGGAEGIDALLETPRAFLSARTPGSVSNNDISVLLDRCRVDGTLPFSILARHGFIAVSLLRSLVSCGVFSPADAERFQRGIHTVAGAFVDDLHGVLSGTLDRDSFIDRYGHLRPGTYDILSPRYDKAPELVFGGIARAPDPIEAFEPSAVQMGQIDELLRAAGFSCDASALLGYMAAAIAAREEAKFAFTRPLSDAIEAIAEWGGAIGMSREELSYLRVDAIFDLSSDDPGAFAAEIDEGRDGHRLAQMVKLPHLIVEPDDIDVVRMPLGEPTFITRNRVTAPPLLIDGHEAADLGGRLVLIESADPGFDWIFSHPIAGLVTKFGGANSHMAIRCAEFGLPAAIGCGERLFDVLQDRAAVELNCGARTIKGIDGR